MILIELFETFAVMFLTLSFAFISLKYGFHYLNKLL